MSINQKELQERLDKPGLPYNSLSFIYGAMSGCAVLPEFLQEGALLCLLYKFSPENSARFVEKSEDLHSAVDYAENCISGIMETLAAKEYGIFYKTQETFLYGDSRREWCRGFLTAVNTWVDQRGADNQIAKPAKSALGMLLYYSDPGTYNTPEIREFKKNGKLQNPDSMIPLIVQDIFNQLEPLTGYYDSLEFGDKPIERDEPKIGRNDPCACGSGQKFKKCCGK
jgi:hypothetical protein